MSTRTGFTGSALNRLLVRLTGTDVAEPRQAFAERLGQWLGWTDAIALAAVLNSGPPALAATRAAPAAGSAEERDVARVRATLSAAIAADVALTTAAEPSDFAACRWRFLSRQQAMDASLAPVRARLRAALATRSPDDARLAALDAVMEQALGAQERRLLATVPALLERHFERLRRAAAADTGAAPGTGWLIAFGHDLQAVLLAELDLRMQPVEGLLDALRTPLKKQAP